MIERCDRLLEAFPWGSGRSDDVTLCSGRLHGRRGGGPELHRAAPQPAGHDARGQLHHHPVRRQPRREPPPVPGGALLHRRHLVPQSAAAAHGGSALASADGQARDVVEATVPAAVLRGGAMPGADTC